MSNLYNILNISESELLNYSNQLNILLSNYQVLSANVKAYHWNVMGNSFFELHEKLDELHSDLASKTDLLAERIVTLKIRENQSLAEYLKHSEISSKTDIKKDKEIVENLIEDLNKLSASQNRLVVLSDKLKDYVTNDLLIEMQADIEKYLWMFSAFLG